MTPELIELAKWGLGLFGGVVTLVAAAIAALFRISFKLGSDAREIKEALKDLGEMKADVKKIPAIETKLDTLAEAQAEDRRRFASEVPPLREKTVALWEKVFSLQEWRKSRPRIGNGNGE